MDFECLVREHSGRIRQIARRFATNGALDDLVQDILTRLWRSYASFRGDSKDGFARLGVLVFIGAATVMCLALIRARSVTRSDDWTLRARIEIEIEKLEKQSRLMHRVSYWFLLPMLIANGISMLGGSHARTGALVPDASGMVFFASCCLVYGFTYWWVRRETKRHWDPVLARLQRLHTDLVS